MVWVFFWFEMSLYIYAIYTLANLQNHECTFYGFFLLISLFIE